MPYRPEKKCTIKTWTIQEFIEKYDTIDCQPVGQRLPVSSTDKNKPKGIIRSILDGINLGTITLMKLPKPSGHWETYVLESIDGGHRKRSIFEFRHGYFSVESIDSDGNVVEKFYSDLSEEEKATFLESEFSVCVYRTLGVQEKGHIFRSLNETTDVNFMEKLNSYGDIPIANFIRETVRRVKGIDNEHHKLFDHCDGSVTNYKHLSFDNDRLKHDQVLSRILLRYAEYPNHLLGGSLESEIEDLYVAKTIDKTVIDKVNKHLDFLHSMALSKRNWSKKGLSQHDFKALSFIYFDLLDRYELFQINDSNELFALYWAAKKEIEDDESNYAEDIIKDGSGYTYKTAYVKYMNAPNSDKKVRTATTILMNEMTIDAIERFLLIKDKTRCFSLKQKEDKLVDQKGRCFIDGKELCYRDAHAAHIIPHSEGGKTDYENLVMVRDIHNQAMGIQNANDYKKSFQAKNKKAA